MSKLINLVRQNSGPIDPAAAFCRVDEYGRCSVCSDEALPARVLKIVQDEWIALAEMDGNETQVDISLMDDVHPGTWLLVHGGVALEQLTEVQA